MASTKFIIGFLKFDSYQEVEKYCKDNTLQIAHSETMRDNTIVITVTPVILYDVEVLEDTLAVTTLSDGFEYDFLQKGIHYLTTGYKSMGKTVVFSSKDGKVFIVESDTVKIVESDTVKVKLAQ